MCVCECVADCSALNWIDMCGRVRAFIQVLVLHTRRMWITYALYAQHEDKGQSRAAAKKHPSPHQFGNVPGIDYIPIRMFQSVCLTHNSSRWPYFSNIANSQLWLVVMTRTADFQYIAVDRAICSRSLREPAETVEFACILQSGMTRRMSIAVGVHVCAWVARIVLNNNYFLSTEWTCAFPWHFAFKANRAVKIAVKTSLLLVLQTNTNTSAWHTYSFSLSLVLQWI